MFRSVRRICLSIWDVLFSKIKASWYDNPSLMLFIAIFKEKKRQNEWYRCLLNNKWTSRCVPTSIIRCRPTVSAYCFPFIRQLFSFLISWRGGNQNASTLAGASANWQTLSLGSRTCSVRLFPSATRSAKTEGERMMGLPGADVVPFAPFYCCWRKIWTQYLEVSSLETVSCPPRHRYIPPLFKNHKQGYGNRENANPLLDTYVIIVCAMPSVFF